MHYSNTTDFFQSTIGIVKNFFYSTLTIKKAVFKSSESLTCRTKLKNVEGDIRQCRTMLEKSDNVE
jgi:hypothetical protein